jgi:hypothetical protein
VSTRGGPSRNQSRLLCKDTHPLLAFLPSPFLLLFVLLRTIFPETVLCPSGLAFQESYAVKFSWPGQRIHVRLMRDPTDRRTVKYYLTFTWLCTSVICLFVLGLVAWAEFVMVMYVTSSIFQTSIALGLLQFCLWHILWISLLTCYLRTVFTDPGSVPVSLLVGEARFYAYQHRNLLERRPPGLLPKTPNFVLRAIVQAHQSQSGAITVLLGSYLC